jgi:hypothetical protein
MRLWIAALALVITTFVMSAPEARASTLATVTSINGSAVVMRGNKVVKLTIGAKIEPGDRIIVAAGGTVRLSSGTSLGAGSSTVTKTKSGSLAVASTTSMTSGSTYSASSPSSNLFSGKSSGSNNSSSSGSSSGNDDDDEYEHRDPEDAPPVTHY